MLELGVSESLGEPARLRMKVAGACVRRRGGDRGRESYRRLAIQKAPCRTSEACLVLRDSGCRSYGRISLQTCHTDATLSALRPSSQERKLEMITPLGLRVAATQRYVWSKMSVRSEICASSRDAGRCPAKVGPSLAEVALGRPLPKSVRIPRFLSSTDHSWLNRARLARSRSEFDGIRARSVVSLGQLGSKLFVRTQARFAGIGANFAHISSNPGRLWPILGELRPKLRFAAERSAPRNANSPA